MLDTTFVDTLVVVLVDAPTVAVLMDVLVVVFVETAMVFVEILVDTLVENAVFVRVLVSVVTLQVEPEQHLGLHSWHSDVVCASICRLVGFLAQHVAWHQLQSELRSIKSS